MDGHYFAKIDELIIGSEENKEQILDHPLQYMIWLKFDQCLGRRRFLKVVPDFSQYRSFFPIEKSTPLHFNKIDPNSGLCQVWWKLAT